MPSNDQETSDNNHRIIQITMGVVLPVLVLLAFQTALAGQSETDGLTIRARISNRGEPEVLDVKEWLRVHHFMEMSGPFIALHQISLLFSLLVAAVAKYCVLKAISMNGLLSRPINVIIIIEQSVHFTVWCVMFVIVFHYQMTQTPLADHVANFDVCEYVSMFAYLGGANQVSCGFVAATCRLICLHCSKLLDYLSQWTVMWILLGLVMSFQLWSSFEYGRGQTTKDPFKELCHGRGPDYHAILMEYKDHGESPGGIDIVVLMELMYGVMLFITAGIYIFICVKNFNHDERMKAILGVKTIKKRHTNNAITLSYHMFRFVLSTTLFSIWLVAMVYFRGSRAQNFIILALDYEIALISVTDALSSVQSREVFLSLWNPMKRFRKNTIENDSKSNATSSTTAS